MTRLTFVLNLLAALGSGCIAGVFFAFSSFVLPALARLPGAAGAVAMQSINVVVLNRSFLGVFLGTGFASVLLVADALWRSSAAGSKLRLAGGALYLLGSVLVTRVCNVPWNDMLARWSPDMPGAGRAWLRFVSAWSSWNHVRSGASLVAAALFTLALSGCSKYWQCAPPDTGRLSQLPQKLSETGISGPNVRQFKPRFELWSDGAVKRRLIALPAGERIDTSDMDNWKFPVGTRLWKEFNVGGTRVETRLLQKTGPGTEDWLTQAYVWLPDGSEALAALAGQDNALGTDHDVPAEGQCRACHGGRKSFVLGFSALQLSYDAEPGLVDLEQLVVEDRISQRPAARFELPGDATAQAALGYVHANCGHCHNQDRPDAASGRCFDPDNSLDFWLKTGELGSVEGTPTYRSGKGFAFEAGAPDDSRMIDLMSTRGFLKQMPPLGTEHVDETGLAKVRHFIAELR